MYEELVRLLRAGVGYLAPADDAGPDRLEVAAMVAQLENLNEDLRKLSEQVAVIRSEPAEIGSVKSGRPRAGQKNALAELEAMREELKLRDAAIQQFQDEEAENLKLIASLQKQLADSKAAMADALASTLVSGEGRINSDDARARREVVAAGEDGRGARLLIRYPKGDEVSIRLPPELSLGRSMLNDIRLSGPAVSRRHAAVRWDGETATLLDCGSTNGVFVNGARVSEHYLHDGDLITVGPLNCIFRAPSKK